MAKRVAKKVRKNAHRHHGAKAKVKKAKAHAHKEIESAAFQFPQSWVDGAAKIKRFLEQPIQLDKLF